MDRGKSNHFSQFELLTTHFSVPLTPSFMASVSLGCPNKTVPVGRLDSMEVYSPVVVLETRSSKMEVSAAFEDFKESP